jgi:pimeloyl-ACP methyl ester carboxylesterase
MTSATKTVTPDGVALNYLDTGHGDPPLLFIHGWCCDHSYWGEQTAHFAQTNRVVAPDLRGFGDSDKPEQKYTMDGFADDVAWLAGELHLDRPVIIGHSMGGVIVASIAQRYPDLARGLVLVDAPVLFDSALFAPIIDAVRADPRAAAAGVIDRFWTEQTPPALRESIPPRMLATPEHVMRSAFLGLPEFDAEPALKGARVPVWIVSASGPIGNAHTRARELNPLISVELWEGAGHFLQSERPEQFNAGLQAFIDMLG